MLKNAVKVKAGRFLVGTFAATATVVAASVPTVLSQGTSEIQIDGSSTVFPISEAMAEEFQAANPSVRVTVGVSGTGGGFSRFCAGETAISNASRPIKEEEIAACEAAGVEYIELPVAYDALTVVVHPENNWVDSLTVDELKTMWEPAAEGTVTNWNQVREGFPDQSLSLYGAGTDSGTFDYFTEAIVGESAASRGDYTASEDDNVIVQGVANDPNALGYFGLAYYEANTDRLKAVAIDGGNGPVLPERANVENGTYQPLSRPLFIYVNAEAAQRPEIQEFVQFHLQNPDLVTEVGYVPLPAEAYTLAQEKFNEGQVGTVFANQDTIGVQIEDLLRLEAQ
jgi:phosphate transport system substrate-binding protein